MWSDLSAWADFIAVVSWAPRGKSKELEEADVTDHATEWVNVEEGSFLNETRL